MILLYRFATSIYLLMNTRRVDRTCDPSPTNMDAIETIKTLDNKLGRLGDTLHLERIRNFN